MSLDPHPEFEAAVSEPGPIPVPAPRYHWYHKFGAVLFILFCLEIGTFLVYFPWSDWWDSNLLSSIVPEWHGYWSNAYLRGAVSGLGVVNLYISFVEIFRLRRFARRP